MLLQTGKKKGRLEQSSRPFVLRGAAD